MESNLKFVIVGDGAGLSALREQVQELSLDNVFFKPLQPYERLPELLSMADIHIVCQLKGAADVVLPSKLTGILAVGGYAVVTAESDTELGRLASEHEGTIELVKPESVEALVAGILKLVNDAPESYNRAARAYAEQYLDKKAILNRFNEEIVALVGKP